MKLSIKTLVLLGVMFPAFILSQSQPAPQDVIQMKNGTIYRGTIVEQLPGVSYKIEIFGGSVVVVPAAGVKKVTKDYRAPRYHRGKPPFDYRDKGYYFQAQANLGLEFGCSMINGYKFGQFGKVGLGIGIEYIIVTNAGGGYVPLFINYSGDILRKKITPFYNVFAGYSFALPVDAAAGKTYPKGGEPVQTNQGGPMGGISFGARFYTRRHKVNFTTALGLKVQNSLYWYHYGYNYSSGDVVMILPAINLGFGF